MTDIPQMSTSFSIRESFPNQLTILFDCEPVHAWHYERFGKVEAAPSYSSSTYGLVIDSRYAFDEVLEYMGNREMDRRWKWKELREQVDEIVKMAKDMGIPIDIRKETE